MGHTMKVPSVRVMLPAKADIFITTGAFMREELKITKPLVMEVIAILIKGIVMKATGCKMCLREMASKNFPMGLIMKVHSKMELKMAKEDIFLIQVFIKETLKTGNLMGREALPM